MKIVGKALYDMGYNMTIQENEQYDIYHISEAPAIAVLRTADSSMQEEYERWMANCIRNGGVNIPYKEFFVTTESLRGVNQFNFDSYNFLVMKDARVIHIPSRDSAYKIHRGDIIIYDVIAYLSEGNSVTAVRLSIGREEIERTTPEGINSSHVPTADFMNMCESSAGVDGFEHQTNWTTWAFFLLKN